MESVRALAILGVTWLVSAAGDRVAATTLVRRLVPVAEAESLAVFANEAVIAAEPRGPMTVVLVPGPVGSAFGMRHITAALADQAIPVVIVDLLGMGTSPRPGTADYSLSQQAIRLRAVLDSLRVDRAVVVAAATGATVALHLAADDPGRVAAVLSLAGGGVDHQGTPGIRLALAFSFLFDNPVGRAIGRRRFESAMREQSVETRWITRDAVRMYLQPFEHDLRGALRTLRTMSAAAEPRPIASRLAQVQAPVQLLVGDKPSASAPTREQVELLRRSLRQFKVDTIPGSGVMLHEEHPNEVVAAILALLRHT